MGRDCRGEKSGERNWGETKSTPKEGDEEEGQETVARHKMISKRTARKHKGPGRRGQNLRETRA